MYIIVSLIMPGIDAFIALKVLQKYMLLLLDAAVTNAQWLGFGSREYDSDVGKFKRECFQNGFGWGTKKFSLSLLWEGEEHKLKITFPNTGWVPRCWREKVPGLTPRRETSWPCQDSELLPQISTPLYIQNPGDPQVTNKQTDSFQENLWKLNDTRVWKLCLGILPRFTSSEEYVWLQRSEQYNESER